MKLSARDSQPLTVRFPHETVAEIESLAEAMRREHPGIPFTKSGVIRSLVASALVERPATTAEGEAA